MTTLLDLLSAAQPAELHLAGGVASSLSIRDVTHDSTQAAPGVLFACWRGQRADGHDYAPAAVAAGSPALLVERRLEIGVPQLQVPSVRAVLGRVAAAVHGNPSESLLLCGVTGTNGKTTTAYLLEAGLRACGHQTGLIGTVESRIAGAEVVGARTTPEATDLQRLFATMIAAGVTAAAIEVSSHGLALGRVESTRFASAVFTNLSHDHLDFHTDLEDYFDAKAQLFTARFTPVGVVNIDDPWGRRLVDRAETAIVRVSASGATDADVTAENVVLEPRGVRFRATLGAGTIEVRSPLAGEFNVANILGALAALEAAGVDPAAAAAGMAAMAGVPGRMEHVDAGQPFTVLVDYAHTPASLERVLEATRKVTSGQLIVVIGCGGDRDQAKRPLMGRAAAALADFAVLTSDNPRSEDPLAILEAVAGGARTVPDARIHVDADRRAAIATALAAARPGDTVVIAGKGHEGYQELATGTVPFDDREVARELLTVGDAAADAGRAGARGRR